MDDPVPSITTTQSESARNVVYSSGAPSESVTCILLSNNTDGQVVHQLIQLPTESVLVVGSEQNQDQVTYHIPHNEQPVDSPEELLPIEGAQSTHYEEHLPPPPPQNTDHNPVYYSQTFCKDCNKIFSSPTKLRDHNLIKHKGLYTCGVCLRGFKTTYCLKNHTATHNEKQFVCCYCDKSFARGTSLRDHIKKIHKKEEKCLSCGRLKEPDHICYKCKECEASFKTVPSFESHSCGKTRIFVCPYCGESFTRNQGLLNHMLNQENKRKFKCVVCNDRFNTQAQLRRHERVHTPDEWFKCRVCGKKYATASGFRSHNIKKHKGHNPNDVKPRARTNQRKLRKGRPHRKFRDDSVQTNLPPCNSRSSQTSVPPSPSSKPGNSPHYPKLTSNNQEFPTSVSRLRDGQFHTSPIRDSSSTASSPERDTDFPSSPVGDNTFVETAVSPSDTLSSPLGETTYQVPALMNCSDDVIITTDSRFD